MSNTYELQQWMQEQFQKETPLQQLFDSAQESGWPENDIYKTLNDAYTEEIQKNYAEYKMKDNIYYIPEPNLNPSRNRIFLSDKVVHIALNIKYPRVFLFDDFLSHEECDHIIELARPQMGRSEVLDNDTGKGVVDTYRTSYGTFLKRQQDEVIHRVESRIAEMLNVPIETGEGLQVLNYHVGAEYKAHHDYFTYGEKVREKMLSGNGQRIATLILYLNDVDSGGGTTVPEINLEVTPKKGSAFFFSYPVSHVSSLTLHSGAPVLDGEKWVATKWFHTGPYFKNV